MEVKPIPVGYKKTVAGVIPNDWRVRHMRDVARVVSGQVDPRIEPYSLMPLVAPDHIESGTGRLARSIPTAEEQQAISGKYLFRSGTVIYSKIRPHLRKVCMAPFDGVCSADMYPLLPADDVHPGFLLASLLSERFSKYAESVSIRSGMPKINREELADFEFVLPSTRQEQAQIALNLADTDALIDLLEELLTKKRQIKQGAMQELLTGKRRLPGFAGEWAERNLAELADIRSGGTPSTRRPEFWDGDIPWCTPTDITALAGGKYISETARSISEKGQKASSAEILPVGTVVMTSRATIGECAISSVPVTTNQGFKNFVAHRQTSAEFLYYLLGIQKPVLLGLCSGSTFLEIGKRQLANFVVRCPIEFDEQEAIAGVLSDMDVEIVALQSRLTKARALKQAMAQALLTGRIRLKESSA